MEALYRKLYQKYDNLKKSKDSELEKLNHDQEVKFMNYVAAADEIIEYLKSENDRLSKQVIELRSEIASIINTKDEEQVQYQKLLMEEYQKNKELSEENERLQDLQREELYHRTRDDESGQLNVTGVSEEEPDALNPLALKGKRKRGDQSMLVTRDTNEHVNEPESESADRSDDLVKAACCRRKIDISGGDTTNKGQIRCVFQDLVECIVGMKLSTVAKNEELSLSVEHQSSGYHFSLTWMNDSNGEPQLLYQVSSLGTFDKVAPEWMRDALMFSLRMCPVFFQRLSHVIRPNC